MLHSVTEVWAIRVQPGDHLLPPLDDDQSDSFIACPTEADANLLLESQIEKGYIEAGEVVRVA